MDMQMLPTGPFCRLLQLFDRMKFVVLQQDLLELWWWGGGRYLAHNTANGNPSGCRYQYQNKIKATYMKRCCSSTEYDVFIYIIQICAKVTSLEAHIKHQVTSDLCATL